jgi:hypothetical protein
MLPHASAAQWSPRRLALLAALAAAVAAAPACDRVPLLAPAGTAITLIAATNNLAVNGSTDITAVLIEGAQAGGEDGGTINGVGTPVHNGTVVSFTTTLGRIEPAEASTTNGQAKVKLIGDGRSGVATITAFSGGSSQTLEINIGSAGAVRVIVTASPQSLPPGGGTALIQARVEDQQGNGLLGVPVSFKTTAGTLSATSAVTNEAGLASTTIQTTAAATVTASAGGGTEGSLSGEIELVIGPRTTISITAPATAAVSTPASFGINVSSTGGPAAAVVTDATINFGDGTSTPLGTLIGGSVNETVIHLFASSGIKTVTVTGKDAEGNTVSRSTQVAVAPLTATGTANPGSTTLGTPVSFTIVVAPLGASIERYEWDFGDGTSATTSGGTISHLYGSKGTKTINVTVVPTVGATLNVQMQIQIN